MIMETYHYGKFKFDISIITWWGRSILAFNSVLTSVVIELFNFGTDTLHRATDHHNQRHLLDIISIHFRFDYAHIIRDSLLCSPSMFNHLGWFRRNWMAVNTRARWTEQERERASVWVWRQRQRHRVRRRAATEWREQESKRPFDCGSPIT